MSSWLDMSVDNLKAAKMLHDSGRARSAASRAYFAAYTAVAARLPKSASFAHGRANPGHEVLHNITKHSAGRHLDQIHRREAVRIVRLLQKNRIVSDYDPVAVVDQRTSLESVRVASRFLDLLKVSL